MHQHILCKHKLLFWMRLIPINRLTALKKHIKSGFWTKSCWEPL